MTIKLGEMLLKEKLINTEELYEALKIQTLFGIKLGSSLIELGFITDEQLCLFLSRKLEVPAVTAEEMSSIAKEVLAMVPADLAGRYRVVPIRLNGKKLALAMADPSDFKAIDDVAFATGCIILPHIIPDVRITAALAEYYQIRSDIRYLRTEDEIAGKQIPAPIWQPVIKADKIKTSLIDKSMELLNIEIPVQFEQIASIHCHDDQLVKLGGMERYSVDKLSIEFASAQNRDEIASVFINYLGQEFTVGALFIIRNNMAVGWCGITLGKRIENLENLALLLSKPSVMKDVLETRQFSMGTLVQTPENLQLLKELQIDASTPLLVLPIVMLNKVVAVVIVSAEIEALGKRLLELQKLVSKASLAFEMLIIKNKILMT